MNLQYWALQNFYESIFNPSPPPESWESRYLRSWKSVGEPLKVDVVFVTEEKARQIAREEIKKDSEETKKASSIESCIDAFCELIDDAQLLRSRRLTRAISKKIPIIENGLSLAVDIDGDHLIVRLQDEEATVAFTRISSSEGDRLINQLQGGDAK
ncbi:MAG: hypothetical protein EOP06_00400 [Proteobacteria bacterium]|nr:MAG: hypothetical protein EOP06_00400 [Pseudomonadota bacterium]